MLQKINTVLLVAILGVLIFVALRPQPSRYYYIRGLEPAVFDTATGQLVLVETSPKLQAWFDEQEAKEKAEATARQQEEMERYCPEVIAGKETATVLPPSKQDCEEWQQAQRPATE